MRSRRYNNDGGCLPVVIVIGVVAIVLAMTAIVVVGCGSPLWTKDKVSFVATDKERVNNGNTSKYIVYSDHEQFEVTDKLILGLFDSSDRYQKIHKGRKYLCEVVGYRWHLMSWYRDLTKCSEVPKIE